MLQNKPPSTITKTIYCAYLFNPVYCVAVDASLCVCFVLSVSVCVCVCVCVCMCVCVSKWWICEKARTQKLLTKALKGVRWMCSSFPEWERLTSVECTRYACINNINNDNSEGEILRTPHTGSRFPKCLVLLTLPVGITA